MPDPFNTYLAEINKAYLRREETELSRLGEEAASVWLLIKSSFLVVLAFLK